MTARRGPPAPEPWQRRPFAARATLHRRTDRAGPGHCQRDQPRADSSARRNAGSRHDAWCAYLIDSPLPNGCFVTAASCELDGQPGELRDRLYDAVTRRRRFLAQQITTAQAAGDLAPDLDPEELVSTLTGLAMAANQEIQLLGDERAAARARCLMRHVVAQ